MAEPKKTQPYDPKAIEESTYRTWRERGDFHPTPDDRPGDQRFSIVIPPPNVTGALHLGHAINNTLQDILIRRARMAGRNTLWLPGTDHAGIATQAVVEKRLKEDQGKTRHDIGRDGLVQRIWDWKDEYETRILSQLRLMGSSCDWDRTRFTLDERCAKAVRYTFFKMFRDGLIYRGVRLVNWDASLQTAVADDEVYHQAVKGYLWHMQYPLTDGSGHLTVATTRPETMLGDTAVAVHPDDERYKHLIGKTVTLPLVGREIPIIGDPLLVKMEFGSGCVKVTPAHDPNDYECGQRNGLEMINILEPDATINANGGAFAGLDRYVARKAVVAALDAEGLLERVEDYETDIGHSDRSKTPIEPYLTAQWFVTMGDVDGGVALADGTKAAGLAQMAMDAVSDGRVTFHPDRYAKTYLDWLGEKRDWCISRQLWWGHRIPVWSIALERPTDVALMGCAERGPDSQVWAALDRLVGQPWRDWTAGGGECYVTAETHPDKPGWVIVRVCVRDEGAPLEAKLEAVGFERDADVLDTWFSSALWPHSTMGWPEKTADLDYYYPTSVLITSRDIITLWVARMVMTGLYNMGEVPFADVYIHPKILDGQGRTMSKSLGNGVDPVDIIEKYGADALRYGMANMCTETQDVRMPVEQETLADGRTINISPRFDIGRNFCNKLWQASTGFVLRNIEGYDPKPLTPADLPIDDRWILSSLQACIAQADRELSEYQAGDAVTTLYRFFWNDFCDWYLEMVKPRLWAGGEETRIAQQVLAWVLDQVLRLLHPIVPFVTEAIWQRLTEAAPVRGITTPTVHGDSVIMAAWPAADASLRDARAEADVAVLQTMIRSIRDIKAYVNAARSRAKAPSVRNLPEALIRADEATCAILAEYEQQVMTLGQCDRLQFGPQIAKPAGSASQIHNGIEVYAPLGDLIDASAEVTRLQDERDKTAKMVKGTEAKLANENFVSRAPAEVVEQQRDQLVRLTGQLKAIEAHIADLQ